MATVDWLRSSDTFHDLSEDDLDALAAIAWECACEPGDMVFNEGDQAEALYLMISGKVALERNIILGKRTGGRRATFDVATSGDVFGWSAAVTPFVMTASAICLERATYLCIDSARLRVLLHERPALGRDFMAKMAQVVSGRLKDTTNRLSYLLSIASHDLKAPLAAVESYLQVMLGGYVGPVSDKQQQMLQRCSERINDCLELVSNFLDMSRLESGQTYSEMEIVSITNVVRRSVEIIRPTAHDKGIAVELDVPADAPGLHASALRLQQALVNVLSNAVKFTSTGGRVAVSLADNGDSVRIEITDSGIGIPADDIAYIFDDFYRGANAGESAGTGLGLPVAKRIVLAHGGRIWAESPVNPTADAKGSRFVITLPRRPSS
ncbi:MAG: ATP-binding protein [Chloroflexota bacterium]